MASIQQLVINPNPMRLSCPIDMSMQLCCEGDAKDIIISVEYTIDIAHHRYIVPQYASEVITIHPQEPTAYKCTLPCINTKEHYEHDVLNASLLIIRASTTDNTVLQELICMVHPYRQADNAPIDARIYSPY